MQISSAPDRNTDIPSMTAMRDLLLVRMAIAVCIIAFAFFCLNFFWLKRNYDVGIFDLIVSIWSAIIAFKVRKTPSTLVQRLSVPYLAIALILYAGVHNTKDVSILFFYNSFPVLLYLLFGKRHGFIASTILLPVGIFVMYVGHAPTWAEMNEYLWDWMFSYLGIWSFAHYYEHSRHVTHEKMLELALHDPLTGLGNRLYFNRFCNQLSKKIKSHALILIDIDHFKHINDSYGHDAGDAVLKQLAGLLQRENEQLPTFRLGGEEFAIIIPLPQRDAIAFGNQLVKSVEGHTFTSETTEISVTISAGLSEYNTDRSDITESLKIADENLYIAKSQGRNRLVAAVERSET